MKKLLALVLALVMCLSFVACGQQAAETAKPAEAAKTEEAAKPAEAKTETKEEAKEEGNVCDEWRAKGEGQKYNILYIPSWAASEYFVNSYECWKAQFAEKGWNLDMQGPKEYNGESELATLEAALNSQQYDAIIYYPIVADTTTPILDEIFETYQVPLITWGMPESSQSGHYYLSPDDRYVAVGHFMAQLALDYVDENMDYFKAEYLDKGEKIPYAVSGSANNPTQNARVITAVEDIEADGRFKQVEWFENVGEKDAQDFGETLATNHPEIEILICYNDIHAINMITAFKTVGGMKPTLRCFGCDAVKASRSLMYEEGEDGFFGGTSGSNHEFVGEILMNMIQGIVPAAKEGKIVHEFTEEAVAAFKAGNEAGISQINITPKNVAEYYTP